MVYPANGEILPDTPFWWSDRFRTMLGYATTNDFPNVLKSWAAIDEMTSTISEIGKSVARATKVADGAVAIAQETNATIE